ncbi:SseB family protein [Rhodophyticola porphyridii]|uniref:SseB family protein n=1 Tax=Rhodophyticola porphyridii TaxID=1852017 RepID=A0A3L9YC39_9RHOB|nr:SseB family protein [Rhodophyticola porphyridii]RMA43753.1 SseB family protein [Rhodophyticola porphyridii]
MTSLDQAHAAMEAAPGDDVARLRFYDRLASAELFLLLESEADGDRVTPQIFPVEGQSFALVFDREERLTDFVGQIAPYAALSGRTLAGMLAGQEIGLGVNLGVAPSSILIDAAAVNWLAQTLDNGPDEVEARPDELFPPKGLPEAVIAALDAKLAGAAGMAKLAYLAGVTYEGGRRAYLLGFVDADPAAERALAQAVAEALTFSGIEAGSLDAAFFKASDPICASLARVGLRFDLPDPVVEQAPGTAPGMDPDTPPRLR